MMDESVQRCRSCGSERRRLFVDLGLSPISNAMLRPDELDKPETFYPLKAFACDACRWVQAQDVAPREAHFHDQYTYFSSISDSWLAHAERYAREMTGRLNLGPSSQVVEVGSNDGYLLRHFKALGAPVLGVDPAANCAEAARAQGIETRVGFYGLELARTLAAEGMAADLIAANNVLAHVPDPNDFVAGIAALLKPDGVATIEFPHLLQLIEDNLFDTIYHEHYSYLSLLALEHLVRRHGLAVFDLDVLPTHGGSLRVHLAHAAAGRSESEALQAFRWREHEAGLDDGAAYDAFADKVRATKRRLLELLIAAKDSGARIAAYGAPAKGVTLLNHCGIGADFLDYAVDRSPHKQGLYLPGVRLPVLAPEHVLEDRPDYLLVLPWNLKDEITAQMDAIRSWGGRFILPLPVPAVIE
jgi:2-polyprenyl-3-methyl-5-hydroxy-6-metoxy-1,4-benzoquinol methylase